MRNFKGFILKGGEIVVFNKITIFTTILTMSFPPPYFLSPLIFDSSCASAIVLLNALECREVHAVEIYQVRDYVAV